MPLVRIAAPFDHPDWLFEIKHDGFRGLAYVADTRCTLVSRNGNEFKRFDALARAVATALKGHTAVLDGEIVALNRDGRADFDRLFYRREGSHFYAFDLLALDGENLSDLPLLERKRRLRRLVPRGPSRLLFVDHLARRGSSFYEAVCAADLEGVVAKLGTAPYSSDGAAGYRTPRCNRTTLLRVRVTFKPLALFAFHG
jgi:bifunctional non-homologous end joining protein LigD